MSLNNELNISVISPALHVMAVKLSSVTYHGIGYIVLCLLFLWKSSTPKLWQFRPLDGALTSFFWQVKFAPKKPNLTRHIINNVDKRRDEKDGSNGLNKSQLFALCSMVENFAFTPFLYFLVVTEASLKDGIFSSPEPLGSQGELIGWP